MTSGHAGEWIAAQIFDIELEKNAAAPAYDGRFRSGPFAGKTVNVKWYLKQEGVLDMTTSPTLDYYLVMTGPLPDGNGIRPWVIESVYLFDAHQLLDEVVTRGVKVGLATSVRRYQWQEARICPGTSAVYPLSEEQQKLLELFAPDSSQETSA
jgi:hypothetical protein